MKKIMILFSLCFANLVLADQCTQLTKAQAELANDILSTSKALVTCDNYDHHNRECGKNSWLESATSENGFSAEIVEKNGKYLLVMFATDLIDLAYEWVPMGKNSYINLATLVGCKKVGATPRLVKGDKEIVPWVNR